MDMPPHTQPDLNNLPQEYWKAEAEYKRSTAKTGGLESQLLGLLWRLIKAGMLMLSLPIRFPLSWWLKQRRKRKREVTLEYSMQFSDVIRKRRMVRDFTDAPVAPEVIDRILDLARHAPSAGFTQGQSFIVVTRYGLKCAIAGLCGEPDYVAGGFHPFISGAPVLLIPCTSEAAYHRRYQEPDKLLPDGTEISWPIPYWHMDIGCAVMVVLLACVNEGLAAGFAGLLDLEAIRTLLKIPPDVTPVGVIPIGHRAPDTPSPSLKRGRKPDAEYIHWEGWRGYPPCYASLETQPTDIR